MKPEREATGRRGSWLGDGAIRWGCFGKWFYWFSGDFGIACRVCGTCGRTLVSIISIKIEVPLRAYVVF